MKCYQCESPRIVPLESITGNVKHKRIYVCLACGTKGTPAAFDDEPEEEDTRYEELDLINNPHNYEIIEKERL